MPTPRSNPDGGDTNSVSNPDGSIGSRFDNWGRRRQSTNTKPSAAAGAGAGTSPTLATTGTDEFGTVTVTAGTSPAAGTLTTITFNKAFSTTPAAVLISAKDSASAALNPYASATTTTLTIGVQGAPTGAAVYNYYYSVVGGA